MYDAIYSFLKLFSTGEVCAVIKLDNFDAGQTSWKSVGSHCWNQAFFLDLDKVGLLISNKSKHVDDSIGQHLVLLSQNMTRRLQRTTPG